MPARFFAAWQYPEAGWGLRVGRARSKPVAAQGGPWTFPKHTLEKAIEAAQALEEKNAGKPLKATDFAPLR